MPIDFKQVAAPSFSDSNTLVAMAAKQQQEAMTGIQGAWTGAMDAVQNNVQGELKNRLNMAGYDDLTDPTKRAALNADMLAFNEQNLGMADMNAMGAYVDGRIPITMANQTGKLAYNEATKAADRLDKQSLKDTKDAAEKSYLDDAVRQGSWLLDSIKQYGTPESNPNFDPGQLAELNNRYTSLTNELNNHPDAESMLPKFYYGLEDFGNDRTIANQKVNQGNLRTDGMSITNDNAVRGMNIRETDLAMRVGNHTGQDAKNTQAKYSKVFAEFPGLVNPDGVSLNYNAGRSLLNGEVAKVKDRSGDRLTDAGTFDEFQVTNRKALAELGNLGMFSNTSHESILKHFEVAASKGVPYSEKEKIEAYRAIATGSIKVDMLPDFASGDAGELKVRKAMKNNFVRDSTAKHKDAMSTGTRESINKVLDLYRASGVPLDQVIGPDGLNLKNSPELHEFLPSDIKEAMGIISKTNSDTYMNSTPGGTSVEQTRNQQLNNGGGLPTVDANQLLGRTPPTNSPSPIRPDNMAEYTPPPVSKPKTTSPSTASSTVNKQMIAAENSRLGKGTIKAGANGQAVWVKGSKPQTLTTVYGESIKVHDTASLNKYIAINQGAEGVQKVKNGQAYIDGKLKYKLDPTRTVPDPKHPLANKVSDNPKHFVPYSKRKADGSAIYPKTQYPSYESQKKRK